MKDATMPRSSRSNSAHPVLLVDSYARGISIGRVDPCGVGLELGLEDVGRSPLPLRSRYVMKSGQPLGDLERHLQRLSDRGELRRATIVFGATTDPFHPFDEKFATSMRFLELFERYAPGRLVIQTRSPLVVIGLPVLKKIRHTTFVSIGIETPLDDVRQRYTPELPSIQERWKTVRALKRFGLKVGVQVAPILPYGDWRSDAGAFAEELSEHADFIVARSVVQVAGAARLTTRVARLLAEHRQFFWLRHDSHKPLLSALTERAPEKLFHPAGLAPLDPQLKLFG